MDHNAKEVDILAAWSKRWRILDDARLSQMASLLAAGEAALRAATADATMLAVRSDRESAAIVASLSANGGSVNEQARALEACRSTRDAAIAAGLGDEIMPPPAKS
jgi:ATP-dependent 26S proteasome regulatory subunit